jgi:hypothetical protein
LTAAASGKPAYEGYKGHGVFTFALLDGLHRGDSNGNGLIELSELVTHVQNQVPKFSAELGGEVFRRSWSAASRTIGSRCISVQQAKILPLCGDFLRSH